MKVLFICEQCNPTQPSVPLLGYEFYKAIREKAHVELVTHGRNEIDLRKVFPDDPIVFIHESKLSTFWGKWASTSLWSLQHILYYPLWMEFNSKVFKKYRNKVHDYDIIHAFTPIIPRYSYKIAKKCTDTPFLLGPVNGGLPFPPGYESIGVKEGSRFNAFKRATQYFPSYNETYSKAKLILSGSEHTQKEMTELFPKLPIKIFSENGVDQDFYNSEVNTKEEVTILFVGRLTPYKGADILIEAMRGCPKGSLLIAGDGPEKERLQKLINEYGLSERIKLLGFVPHEKLPELYHSSHIFAFPSIREFGGAVVMEAMAASLPCIIPNYGGIAEYLPSNAGFKVPLTDRKELIHSFSEKINLLVKSPSLRKEMGEAGYKEAQKFRWEKKGDSLIEIYKSLL